MDEDLWIKINEFHKPAVGHAIYDSLNHPEDGEGTLYYVTAITDDGFTMQSHSNTDGDIPDGEKQTIFIPYESILETNLWVWDRERENNYGIEEKNSN